MRQNTLLSENEHFGTFQDKLIEDTHKALKYVLEGLPHAVLVLECGGAIVPEAAQEAAPPQSVTSSKRAATKYTDFIAEMLPVLYRLHPGRNHKLNLVDAARLWKLHRHLEKPEHIVGAAKAQAAVETGKETLRSVSIAFGRERSLSSESSSDDVRG